MNEKLKKFCVIEKDKDGNDVFKKEEDGSYAIKQRMTAAEKMEFSKVAEELEVMLKDAEERQKGLLQLAQKWVTEGVFEKGYYHGDLHAGNIMVGEKGVTAIDFGNATEMTSEQQKHVTIMMTAAAIGDAVMFRHSFHLLLQNTPEKVYQEKREELTLMFQDVMSMGTQANAGERIAVALLKAQELGLELPPVIANFSSCQMRIQNAVDTMNKTLTDLRANMLKVKKESEGMTFENRQMATDPVVRLQKDLKGLSATQKRVRITNALQDYETTREEEFKRRLLNKDKRTNFRKLYNLPVVNQDMSKEVDRIEKLLKGEGELTDKERDFLNGSNEDRVFPLLAAYRNSLKDSDPVQKDFMDEVFTILDECLSDGSISTISEGKSVNFTPRSLFEIEQFVALKKDDCKGKFTADRKFMDKDSITVTESQTKLDAIYSAQDRKLPQEKLDSMIADLFQTYKKEFGQREQERIEKRKEEHKKTLHQLLPKQDEKTQDMRLRNLETLELAIRSCGDNPVNGEELKKAAEELMSIAKNCITNNAYDEESVKKMDQAFDKVEELLFNATGATLRKMRDEAMDSSDYNAKYEPGDFLSVMTDVIDEYQVRTLSRLGFFSALKAKKKMEAGN